MNTAALRRLFVLANHFKEGDLLVGGTTDELVRRDARRALRAITLGDIRRTPIVDDGITLALDRSIDAPLATELDALTVEQFTAMLLRPDAADWIDRYQLGLTSEAIAAAAKVMTNDQLSYVARTVYNPHAGEGIAVGTHAHFGSRIQPNSPGDNEEEILFSILEGLAHGCGDVILGLNPASDEPGTIARLEELLRLVVERLRLPTRYCVLSDLPKQHQVRQQTTVDVGFQSLAGTSKALTGMVGLDVDGVLDLARSFPGLYFETGQGSAVTNGVAEGVDMVTLEARAYGVARHIGRATGAWMIVNDVAGFIGPEVFKTAEQLERTCLEDIVMAKLHGLTMGLDVCATFHMGISPSQLRELTTRIVDRAAPAYLMAVAGNADPMLGYLTTSFRDHPKLRRASGRQMTSVMRQRLTELGTLDSRGDARPDVDTIASLYGAFVKAGGDRRSLAAVAEEGRHRLGQMRERGFDLGYGSDASASIASDRRLDAIYNNARLALYAALDPGVIADAMPQHLGVRTTATDRDDYLAHPPRGERLHDDDVVAVSRMATARRSPLVQFVVSDGLNANAINEHLRALVPPLRQSLRQTGVNVGAIDVIVQNGRVRAGYHVGQLLDVDVIVHFIGERPGTGLNTASAYLTYGRDLAGRSRFSPALDHSATAAVCGIHPRGKAPAAAVEEIARTVKRMLETRRSGVVTVTDA